MSNETYTIVTRESEAKIFAISDDSDLMEDLCASLNDGEVELPGVDEADDFVTTDIEVPEDLDELIEEEASVDTEYGAFSYREIAEALKRANEDSDLEEEESVEIGESVSSNPDDWQ